MKIKIEKFKKPTPFDYESDEIICDIREGSQGNIIIEFEDEVGYIIPKEALFGILNSRTGIVGSINDDEINN